NRTGATNRLRILDGVQLGEPALTNTDGGSAMRFSAGAPRLYAPGPPVGWNNSAFTITAWVTIDSLPSRGAPIKCGGDGSYGSPNPGVGLRWGGTDFDNDGTQLIGLYECRRWIQTGWHFPGPGTSHLAMSVNAAGTATFFV